MALRSGCPVANNLPMSKTCYTPQATVDDGKYMPWLMQSYLLLMSLLFSSANLYVESESSAFVVSTGNIMPSPIVCSSNTSPDRLLIKQKATDTGVASFASESCKCHPVIRSSPKNRAGTSTCSVVGT